MNLQSKLLAACTDEQLLRELVRRNPFCQGPVKSNNAQTIRETTVGIGNDHSATILIHVDGLESLNCRGAFDE